MHTPLYVINRDRLKKTKFVLGLVLLILKIILAILKLCRDW
jgi:hypothetical protein